MWDTRLKEAVDCVGRRRPDGRWKLENTFNGKMNVSIEQKGDRPNGSPQGSVYLERFEKFSNRTDRKEMIRIMELLKPL
jgi:hypothetical protein